MKVRIAGKYALARKLAQMDADDMEDAVNLAKYMTGRKRLPGRPSKTKQKAK